MGSRAPLRALLLVLRVRIRLALRLLLPKGVEADNSILGHEALSNLDEVVHKALDWDEVSATALE